MVSIVLGYISLMIWGVKKNFFKPRFSNLFNSSTLSFRFSQPSSMPGNICEWISTDIHPRSGYFGFQLKMFNMTFLCTLEQIEISGQLARPVYFPTITSFHLVFLVILLFIIYRTLLLEWPNLLPHPWFQSDFLEECQQWRYCLFSLFSH